MSIIDWRFSTKINNRHMPSKLGDHSMLRHDDTYFDS